MASFSMHREALLKRLQPYVTFSVTKRPADFERTSTVIQPARCKKHISVSILIYVIIIIIVRISIL